MRRIEDEFVCRATCLTCHGMGHVCEEHPDLIWGGIVSDESDPYPGACYCGAAGMPCTEINR